MGYLDRKDTNLYIKNDKIGRILRYIYNKIGPFFIQKILL